MVESMFVHSEGATGRIQPLDVFYNRQFKDLFGTISRLIRRRRPEHTISIRKNLGRLVSIIHHQFTAQMFRPMIEYAWYKAGYYSERPPSFRTPAQYYVFDNKANTECDCCEELFLLRCAHCNVFLCFDHIIEAKHVCWQY